MCILEELISEVNKSVLRMRGAVRGGESDKIILNGLGMRSGGNQNSVFREINFLGKVLTDQHTSREGSMIQNI